ncbi:MAG: hypothetical protein RL410_1066, partial [Actinomycetota bacterium]
MSDEKIQWSPEQPDDWQGAPLGTPSEWPAPATPPIQPSAPSSLAPVPVGAAVRASFQLLKAQYHRYLAISALSMGLGAIAASAVVTVLRANNMINDELIALVFRDTRFDELTAQEKDFLGAHVPGLILFAATTVLLAVLAQMVAQIAITARSLSRVSSTPEVPALKFSWWKAISSQLACLIVVLAAITPFGILLLLAASSTGAAILALVAFLAFLVFVVWFAVVSMMTLQHSIATGVGGFACIKQTIA